MSRYIKSILFSAILATTSLAQAANLTGSTLEWAPFTGAKLQNGGIATDIVTKVFKKAGYDLSVAYVPWARALEQTKSGESEVLVGVWYNKERAEQYVMSAPFLHNRIVFIQSKGDNFEFQGLDSLKGKNVGVIRDYSYSKDFTAANGFKKVAASNLVSNLKKLAANRIELTLEDEIVARYTINEKLPKLKDKFTFSSNALGEEALHIAIRRGHPQGQQLIEAFNQALVAMKTDGSYDAILKSHGL